MTAELPAVQTLLLQILRDHPQGLSEHALLQIIAGQDQALDIKNTGQPLLTLFQRHFLLFYHLYQLRDYMWRHHLGRLEISPLKIVINHLPTGRSSAIDEHDVLQDYYSDLANLETTTAHDLATWLGRFWAGLPGNERRKRALAVLGLEDPVDDAGIKHRYRQLAMEHHPDRGGDHERLQAINMAMQVLSGTAGY